jgi:transposase
MSHSTRKIPELTIGLDVGDKNSYFAVLDYVEEFLEEGEVETTKEALRGLFKRFPSARVVQETGTHSAWISDLLEELGHEVIVANARRVAPIYRAGEKLDPVDARMLARLGRFDVKLVWPTCVRGARERKALTMLKAREELVKSRTQQVNHIRSQVKSWGGRIAGRTAKSFGNIKAAELPKEVRPALMPLVKMIRKATSEISAYDRRIEKLCTDHYPETKRLMQVNGVGPITALAFVLVIGPPRRFKKSRSVGSYVGLTPRQAESGESKPELSISKRGDGFLRKLLVGSSQYILGPFGTPCDLRQFGSDLAAKGQKNAKRKAVVAVARKLAVLLHHLWLTGEKYDPWYNESRKGGRKRGRGVMKTTSEPTVATS